MTVATLSPDRYEAEIEASTAVLAGLLAEHDLSLHIPTCPDWTLRELTLHVGRAHRWAAEICRTRAAEFIPFREVPDRAFPADRAEQDWWLRDSAARIIETVRAAGDDVVWSFVGSGPASFWRRRMAHETLVHRADGEIAAGREPVIDAGLAADAIDEWLCLLSGPAFGKPDPRPAALPAGAALHVHVTDDEVDGGEWLVGNTGTGVVVERAHGKGDAAIAGPAGRLLLVLSRRLPASDPAVTVHGNAGILAGWLAGTPF
jgi:uncharacterized protein (TIGR03083 family)